MQSNGQMMLGLWAQLWIFENTWHIAKQNYFLPQGFVGHLQQHCLLCTYVKEWQKLRRNHSFNGDEKMWYHAYIHWCGRTLSWNYLPSARKVTGVFTASFTCMQLVVAKQIWIAIANNMYLGYWGYGSSVMVCPTEMGFASGVLSFDWFTPITF